MAYGKTRRCGSILTREKNLNYLKWWLNEGPNDIRMTVQQYLSRYKHQVQFKIFPGHEEQLRFCVIYLNRHLDSCVSGHLSEEVFRVIKASFTDNNYYARSKYCSERKFSRPKTRQRSSCTRRGFLNKGKEIYL